MSIITDYIPISTKGFTDIIDITPQVRTMLNKSGMKNGTLTVFISGSTAGIIYLNIVRGE